MEILKSTQSHISDIILLSLQVQEIHLKHHPDQFKNLDELENEAFDFFDTILKKDRNYIYIAYKSKNPAGYIWFTLDEIPENPFKYKRHQLYIHQITVHNQFMNQSVGTNLVSQAAQIAANHGVSHFELDSWGFNSDAHKFFNKVGFETFAIRMWRNAN